jgi:hypothetical protein
MRQLDSGAGYRRQIERDLATRLAQLPPGEAVVRKQVEQPEAPAAVGHFCTECGTKNEADAKFCKNCGHRL